MARLLTSILFFLALPGCGTEGHDDLREFMDKTGKDGASKIEPLPEVKKLDVFEYQPADLLDPFMARNLRPTAKGIQPELDRPRQPLEEFPLDALRLVGTMKKAKQPVRAVIKDPKGTLHTIQVGGRLGQNYGKVVSINEDGMEIKELMQDAGGEWNETKAMMSMAEGAAK